MRWLITLLVLSLVLLPEPVLGVSVYSNSVTMFKSNNFWSIDDTNVSFDFGDSVCDMGGVALDSGNGVEVVSINGEDFYLIPENDGLIVNCGLSGDYVIMFDAVFAGDWIGRTVPKDEIIDDSLKVYDSSGLVWYQTFGVSRAYYDRIVTLPGEGTGYLLHLTLYYSGDATFLKFVNFHSRSGVHAPLYVGGLKVYKIHSKTLVDRVSPPSNRFVAVNQNQYYSSRLTTISSTGETFIGGYPDFGSGVSRYGFPYHSWIMLKTGLPPACYLIKFKYYFVDSWDATSVAHTNLYGDGLFLFVNNFNNRLVYFPITGESTPNKPFNPISENEFMGKIVYHIPNNIGNSVWTDRYGVFYTVYCGEVNSLVWPTAVGSGGDDESEGVGDVEIYKLDIGGATGVVVDNQLYKVPVNVEILEDKNGGSSHLQHSQEYTHRILIQNNNDFTLVDYQVRVIFDWQNVGDELYWNCPSCILITDEYDHQVSYYLEMWNARDKVGALWVKVSIPAQGSVELVLHSSPKYHTFSEPEKVFDFYDDFRDLSKWSVLREEGIVNVVNNKLHLLSRHGGTTIGAPFTADGDVIIEASVDAMSTPEAIVFAFSAGSGVTKYGDIQSGYRGGWNGWPFDSNRNRIYYHTGGTSHELASTSNNVLKDFHHYILGFAWFNEEGNAKFVMYNNYNPILETTLTNPPYSETDHIVVYVWTYADYFIDWIRVRKIVNNPPVVTVD